MSEEATVEPGALEKKIIRQVEFYFGDRNLRRDKFLLEQVKKDDGWVPLSVLLTFNRLKQLSTDPEVVTGSLRMSTMLEVSEDGSKVRRMTSTPLPDPMQKRSAEQQLQEQQRTVYAKGFPLDITLDQLEEYFDQFGPYDIITMRKRKEVSDDGKVTTVFKGSVFVEFKEESSAAKFIEAEELKYKDSVLLREFKSDYIKRKKQEENDRKKAQLEEEEKKKKEARPKVEYSHGHILKFVGCGGNTDREKIKAFFTKYATVLWVEFSRGDTKGYVRFQEEDGARRAVDGATADAEDGKVLISGGESQLSIAEGEDENNFYKRMEETHSAKLKQLKGGGKGKPKKRQRENTRNKPNKQQKADNDSTAVKKDPEDEADESNTPAANTGTTAVKKDPEDEADESNTPAANTGTKDESPPSPKRVKQEQLSDDCNEAIKQETKQHDDNTTPNEQEES